MRALTRDAYALLTLLMLATLPARAHTHLLRAMPADGALPPQVPGRYLVRWRALSADDHVASGTLGFTVRGG